MLSIFYGLISMRFGSILDHLGMTCQIISQSFLMILQSFLDHLGINFVSLREIKIVSCFGHLRVISGLPVNHFEVILDNLAIILGHDPRDPTDRGIPRNN